MAATKNQEIASKVDLGKNDFEPACVYDAEHGQYRVQEDVETHLQAGGKPVDPKPPFQIKR